ncbi:phosphotransferase [Gordonia sp. (in: high G+C Gram-positive bacteria)]|uniref:phosphotransferase n=1 Tax=Gordonia sp. (in: high G+C Gram-positive bacteria) TaxID=84139 RepID=UPI00352783F8
MIALIDDDALTPPAATMASPQWWGADSLRARKRLDGSSTTAFVKTITDVARTYLDIESSFAVSAAAGARGIGPEVFDADASSGRLVMADLTEDFATASLEDFNHADRRAALIAQRRAVWELDVPRARKATVFDDVRALHERSVAAGAQLPADLPWMLRALADAERRIEATGYDTVLIHGDANCSNVAIDRETGRVLLLDFDWAAVADPVQDVGSLVLELGLGNCDARAVFEEIWGGYDERLYARAKCYGFAEAVRGGLIGAWADHCDPGTLEYSKFSDWMFLWARVGLSDHAVDDYLRSL